MLLSLTTGLALLGAVSAHTGCGGHEIGARNLGGRVITKRQVADNVEGKSRSVVCLEWICHNHPRHITSARPASCSGLPRSELLSDPFVEHRSAIRGSGFARGAVG